MAISDRWWEKILTGTNRAANAVGLKDDAADAKRSDLLSETVSELDNIPLPELQRLALEDPSWLEDLSYEDISAMTQGNSLMSDISVDPRLKDNQLASLAALEEISDSGGMNSQDEANLSRIQNQAATQDRGRRESIKQSMQQRGMGGSGMDLLAQLQSSQASTDRQAQQGLDVAGMAQDRALSAIMQSGSLSGQMRGQEFSEQSQQASAQDAINRFNTGNQNRVNQYNSSNQNRVNQYNNAGRQGVADAAVNNNNQESVYNQGLNQQNFDNEMNRVGAKAQARGQQVGDITNQSNRNQETNANFMSGVVKAGTKLFSADEKKKDDDEDGGWF